MRLGKRERQALRQGTLRQAQRKKAETFSYYSSAWNTYLARSDGHRAYARSVGLVKRDGFYNDVKAREMKQSQVRSLQG